ncbi:MAG: PKD domain-containing protein [Prevotellaceae bacterium]|jgi:PKD repeat protein|nr:PKD domain-containing protein [Prevotellaceae bacterium]
MKQKLATCLWALLCSAVAMTSCKENDDNNDSGEGGETTQLTADFTFAIGENNLVTFTNTSSGSYAASEWSFGDQSPVATTKDATHTYPTAGTYHVTLKITASDATEATKQKDVVIEHDDVSGLLTPTVQKLIGGSTVGSEQVWVLDRWNSYIAEVAEETGKTILGHYGLGEFESYSSAWWGAGKDEKTAIGWRIYEETFTFSLAGSGLKLDINNPGGKGYGRLKDNISSSKFPDATAWLDPTKDNAASDAEAEFTYAGGSYTFSVTEPATEDDYPRLTLTGDAFLTYWVGTQEYEIIYLTNEVLAVRAPDPKDGEDAFDWIFVFIRQDLCPEEDPNPDPGPNGGPNNSDDFEGEESIITADGTSTGSGVVDNPFKTGLNTSDKVYKFEKTADYYSSVYYWSSEKFDLSTNNKIKVKVYIPSTNDYATEGALAGEWLSIKTLQKQLVLKLQDSEKGGNAWQNQIEVKNAGSDDALATDTWINLTFDFANASSGADEAGDLKGVAASERTDLDKIIIQFGQEGHDRTGTFYFDDLEFFVEE